MSRLSRARASLKQMLELAAAAEHGMDRPVLRRVK
jgi:hypothetical protein